MTKEGNELLHYVMRSENGRWREWLKHANSKGIILIFV